MASRYGECGAKGFADVALHEEADMSRERCEEVMRRYLSEVLGARRLTVISEIASEDMFDHTQPKPGREGLERHAGGFLAAIPNVQIVIDHIVADENTVVGIWTWCGTPVVEFFGVPPILWCTKSSLAFLMSASWRMPREPLPFVL